MKNLPFFENLITREDSRIESYSSDTIMHGTPDAVYRASDPLELKEILSHCYAHRIPVTICGNQTSLTGSSITNEGLLISTENMDRILDIDLSPSFPRIIVEPGIFLAHLQDYLLKEHRLFYPPDPTSRKEVRLGGTVGTNATGEDSLLYGSTRHYMQALKFLTIDGKEHYIERRHNSPLNKEKNRAGYFLSNDPIDTLIGSEGTLVFFTEITLNPIANPPGHFMKNNPDCFSIPETAQSALYFKQNYSNEQDRDYQLDLWLLALNNHLCLENNKSLIDSTIVAFDRGKQDWLRDIRHYIPTTINEMARPYLAQGGGKIGTDWWVPIDNMELAIQKAVDESHSLGCPFYLFGHIGNGHPHFNYLTRNSAEKKAVMEMIIEQCRKATQWGGGVAGEHGIGKVKRHLLKLEYPTHTIEEMMRIKKTYDPYWILGRNTLFSFPC